MTASVWTAFRSVSEDSGFYFKPTHLEPIQPSALEGKGLTALEGDGFITLEMKGQARLAPSEVRR